MRVRWLPEGESTFCCLVVSRDPVCHRAIGVATEAITNILFVVAVVPNCISQNCFTEVNFLRELEWSKLRRRLVGVVDEHAVRTLVHQLMSVGRDVRSTPMHWAFEAKKTTCAVKHLSWRPPWVRSREEAQEDDRCVRFLGSNERVVDGVGLGRIPMFWWTQNCAYNAAYTTSTA